MKKFVSILTAFGVLTTFSFAVAGPNCGSKAKSACSGTKTTTAKVEQASDVKAVGTKSDCASTKTATAKMKSDHCATSKTTTASASDSKCDYTKTTTAKVNKENCDPANCDTPKKATFKTMATADLHEMIQDGKKAIIIDARSAKYDDGKRIPGAHSLTDESSADDVAKVIPAKDDFVVTYCSSVKCPASKNLAKHLDKLGYTNVMVYEEGLEAWLAAGHKVDEKNQDKASL